MEYLRGLGIFGESRPVTGEAGANRSLSAFPRFYNPDELVGSKGLEVYDRMQNDAQVQACLSIKRASVLARGWEIKPSERDGSRGKGVAEFCHDALDAMPGSLTWILWNICDALAKGFSVSNLVWEVSARPGTCYGKWVPKYIKCKDPAEWEIDCDEHMNVIGLHHTPTAVSYPVSRFIVYAYNSRYENPYGRSDLCACYKNWWSKDFLTRFWNLYLEKYGAPTVKGKYRRGTPKAVQDELLVTLGRIKEQSAIVLPEDFEVELLETIRQGDSGYRLAVDYHDKQISKAILNSTLMTDEGGGVGSFALAKIHLDILRMCLRGLKMDLEETVMREQVLRPMVAYNFGIDVPVPTFSLGPLEERDMAVLSSVVKTLVDAGCLDPTDEWIKEFLGLQGSAAGPGRPDPVPTVTRTRTGQDPEHGNDAKVSVSG